MKVTEKEAALMQCAAEAGKLQKDGWTKMDFADALEEELYTITPSAYVPPSVADSGDKIVLPGKSPEISDTASVRRITGR